MIWYDFVVMGCLAKISSLSRLLLFLSPIHVGFGAQILAFFPLPYLSHQYQFQVLVKELSRRGHQVTFYTSFPIPAELNLEVVQIPAFDGNKIFGTSFEETHDSSVFKNTQTFLEGEVNIAKFIWAQQPVKELLVSNRTFDLVLNEAFILQGSFAALAHRFKALSVSFVTVNDFTWAREFSGLPDNPSYMVDYKSVFTERMSFLERITTAYHLSVALGLGYWYALTKVQNVLDNLAVYPGSETRPPLIELMSDHALILSNSHHSFGYSYPRAPHLKEIGGTTIEPNKPLPQDLEKFMNDSEHGVIYFSFGTVTNWSSPSLQPARDTFIKTFAKIKQRVLWKWSEPDPPKVSPNVLISKWFPQQDILAHKNVKLFITQCGILSTTEAISSGVPLIGIPMFGDQIKTAVHMKYAGYGVRLTRENLTDTSLEWALNEVLHNPKYKNEAKRRSKLFHDRPMKPLDEAVYWIEYVLRHGKVLQPASVHMRFYQVYCLDIIAAILLAATILFLALRYTVKTLLRFMPSMEKSVNSSKKVQ